MNKRTIHTILLAAALAILANCLQPAGALASSAPCCCSGDTCKCCCSPRQAPQPSDLLFGRAASAAGDCSCSSGPNPYGRDANTSSIAAEPNKQRYMQHKAPLSCSVGTSFCSALGPSEKPPPRTVKCLYLLHSSLLI